jgi:hypothetical protein
LLNYGVFDKFVTVTGVEVIEQIKRMPREERLKVIEYARYAEKEQLSPDELETVLKRMVDATDSVQKERLKAEFMRGFYGNEPHA